MQRHTIFDPFLLSDIKTTDNSIFQIISHLPSGRNCVNLLSKGDTWNSSCDLENHLIKLYCIPQSSAMVHFCKGQTDKLKRYGRYHTLFHLFMSLVVIWIYTFSQEIQYFFLAMGREGLMGKAFQKFSLISIISTDQETKANISLDAKNIYPNYTFGIQGNNHRVSLLTQWNHNWDHLRPEPIYQLTSTSPHPNYGGPGGVFHPLSISSDSTANNYRTISLPTA